MGEARVFEFCTQVEHNKYDYNDNKHPKQGVVRVM